MTSYMYSVVRDHTKSPQRDSSLLVSKTFVWRILVLTEMRARACVCVCVREREREREAERVHDYAVVFTYLCFPYSHVHVNQNYLVGLQRTVRNATDLRKTLFIPKGVTNLHQRG